MRLRLIIALTLASLAGSATAARAQQPEVQSAESVGARPITLVARPRGTLAAVGTGFTYQGQLRDSNGQPVTATCQFEFRLYDARSGGSQVGQVLRTNQAAIRDGLFAVALDFGANAFTGEERHLQIGVDCGGGMVQLSPRTTLYAAPFALYSLRAPWTGLIIPPTAAGAGLEYSNFQFRADTNYLQRRVAQVCPDASAIARINADGSVVCVSVLDNGAGGGLQLPFEGTVNSNNVGFRLPSKATVLQSRVAPRG
jgi:hypothetical protein